MSQRDQIRMSQAEIDAFLAERQTMQVATNGRDGFPHLVPMWYGYLEDSLALWTYAKSQKVLNLRRDNRLTALVEAGESYAALRGIMLRCRGAILEDYDSIVQVGLSVQRRYAGPLTASLRQMVEKQSAKRVVVRLDVEETISWDHRKLKRKRNS